MTEHSCTRGSAVQASGLSAFLHSRYVAKQALACLNRLNSTVLVNLLTNSGEQRLLLDSDSNQSFSTPRQI